MRAKITLGTTNATAYEQLLRDPDTYVAAPQSGRAVFRLPEFEVAALGAFRALSFRNTDGAGANAGHLSLTATLQLALLPATGGAVNTSTYTLTPGVRYDLQAAITPGTTTTDGVLEYRLSKWDDTAVVYATAVVPGVNAGGGFTIKGVRYAATAVVTVANIIRFGAPQAKALASGWINALTTNPGANTYPALYTETY